LLGGDLQAPESLVYGFATDDRSVRPGDAFLAISGAQFDGHEFVDKALAHGAVVCVTEREIEGPYIYVRNLVDALAMMGRRLRATFEGPVIGITGSAGKTTTKEFVARALHPLGRVLKTEGNQNTEYTGPLVWTGLEPDTAAVVVEMAMRGFGQIAHLASLSKPTIGIVTNIGYGHLEMVKSRDGIARAKCELLDELPPDGIAIFWQEDDFLPKLKERAGGREVRTFGFSPEADCQILTCRPLGWDKSAVEGIVDGVPWKAVLPAVGRHIALNAATAILVAALVGVDPQAAADELALTILPAMRMEVREVNGATVLLDTYNASPPAVIAAVEALLDAEVTGRRLAVLGEMKELGKYSEELHREVGRAVGALDAVMFIGDPMTRFAREAALEMGLRQAEIASSIEEVRTFIGTLRPGDVLLIKGSRALQLERALEHPAA
jgi:UDP-N-acetylmuramoyl-tripeptide--D-alanyl-D-alanine ligase